MRVIIAFLASLLISAAAGAQTYPTRPVKVVVNFPAGSAIDIIGRAFCKLLADQIGQPIVIENRVGAGGNLGVEAVVRAPADGYTLLFTPGSAVVTNLFLYRTDLPRSLTPIASPYYQPLPLVVRADGPFQTAADIVAQARAKPDTLKFGSAGHGSPMHMAAQTWMFQSGFSASHVPYKATTEAIVGLINGDIDFTFDAGPAIPFVRQGKVRMLGLAGSGRTPMFPNVPTLAEAVGAQVDMTLPGGLYAPPNTPAAIVAQLHEASAVVWRDPRFREALAPIFAEPAPTFMTVPQIEAQLVVDRERIGKLIRDANITVN